MLLYFASVEFLACLCEASCEASYVGRMSGPSFAAVAASSAARNELKVTEVTLNWSEVERAKSWIGKEGSVARVEIPKEQEGERKKKKNKK